MASSLDNAGTSSPPLQKLVNLPPEEANKAPFPPGCRVICFMKDGTPNVGIVKSVQLSISFKAGGTFNTYYQVEIQKSWRDPKSHEVSVYQMEADDLRLTPGCPVYISSHYFGTESDILQGKEGLIEGVLLGCFETPCMNCRRDAKKTSDDMISKRRFSYSVEFKMKGVDEVAEEHGVPPEFVTYRSTKPTKKEGIIVATLEDIGVKIIPGIFLTASDGTSSTANTTTTSSHISNRDDTTTITNKTAASTLNDLNSDVRRRPLTNSDSAPAIDFDFYRSYSFDKNFNSINKSSNSNMDQSLNSDTSSKVDHTFSNDSPRRTSMSHQRSPISTDYYSQSKFEVSTDARIQPNSRTSNTERGILRSSSFDGRTSLGRSTRHSVTFADNDEVHEHSSSDSRSNSGIYTAEQPGTHLDSHTAVRTYAPSKHLIELASQDNRTKTMQELSPAENQGYESALEKNHVSKMNSHDAVYASKYSEMSRESNNYESSNYERYELDRNYDNRRRINENQSAFMAPEKGIPKGNSIQEPTYMSSQDWGAPKRESVYSPQPQQQGTQPWGDIRRAQSYDVNTASEAPYSERWGTRSSYDQTRRPHDLNTNLPHAQNTSYPKRSSKEELQQNINYGRGLNRYQENTIVEINDNEGSPRRSNETTAEKIMNEEIRRNSTDGLFQRQNESTPGKFVKEDTYRHLTNGSTQRSYEDNLKTKNIYEPNRRSMQPEDGKVLRSTQSEGMDGYNTRKPRWNNPASSYDDSKVNFTKENGDTQRPPTEDGTLIRSTQSDVREGSPPRKPRWNNPAPSYNDSKVNFTKEKDDTQRLSTDDGTFLRSTQSEVMEGSPPRKPKWNIPASSYNDSKVIFTREKDDTQRPPTDDGTLLRSTQSDVREGSPPRKPRWNIPTTSHNDSKVNAIQEKDDTQRPPMDISHNRHVNNDEVQKRPTEVRSYRTNQQYGMNGIKSDFRNGSFEDHQSNNQGGNTNIKVVIETIQQSNSHLDSKDDESDKKSDVSPSSVIVQMETTTMDNEPKEDPIPERNEEEGCYLVYTENSGGKLVLCYSRTVIEDAVGFWMPKGGKKFQGFKFSHNQGKVDLIKGIMGGDSNRRKYYHGWCQFFKAAATADGVICKRPARGGIEVDLWVFYYETCTIEKVEDSQLFDATRIYAIACVPKNTMLFNGMKTSELGQFLQKGQLAGASITIDGNV